MGVMFKENHRSTTRKRLLLIGPLPPPFAGPEIGTKTLLESPLLNRIYDIRLINTTVRASNRDKGRLDAHLLIAYIRYVPRLIHALVSFRPHYVLYTATSASLKGWVRDGTTLLLCGVTHTKLVTQLRGGHFGYFYRQQPAFIRAALRYLLRRCHLMLVQSNNLKRQFHGILSPERLGTLPNAIPRDFIDYFETVRRPSKTTTPTVLFVGHLSVAKGYCDLLRVIPALARRYNARFLLMGARMGRERNVHVNQATGQRLTPEDPEALYTALIASQGLEEHIEFLGDAMDGPAKCQAFARADIFVLPSYSEGFSRAILEGMAAGLPVVATRVGAAEEIMEDSVQGYLIEPGDIEALRDRLERLIADGNRRLAMGAQARARCHERFLESAVSRKLIDYLETSLSPLT